MKRPTSVSIIAWFLIVTALISVATSYSSMSNPLAQELMAKSMLSIPAQYVLMFVGLAITLATGIAMLKGLNWGRTVYIGWSALGLVIALVTSPIKVAVVPGAVIFAIIAFFLYRPTASAYFLRKEAANDA